MKTKSIGFGEAVRSLAGKQGCNLIGFQILIKKDLRFQTYKNILKEYLNYFHQQLFNSENKEALEYLLKRNLKKI